MQPAPSAGKHAVGIKRWIKRKPVGFASETGYLENKLISLCCTRSKANTTLSRRHYNTPEPVQRLGVLAIAIDLPIAFITAIAPAHEVPRAARKDSTEHTSLTDGSNKERKDRKSTGKHKCQVCSNTSIKMSFIAHGCPSITIY